MTIVPGMWYKLLHGNAIEFDQRIYVASVFEPSFFQSFILPATVTYDIYIYQPTQRIWKQHEYHVETTKTNFMKAFEPASL